MWNVLGIVILVIIGLAVLGTVIEAIGGGGIVIVILLILAGIGLISKTKEG